MKFLGGGPSSVTPEVRRKRPIKLFISHCQLQYRNKYKMSLMEMKAVVSETVKCTNKSKSSWTRTSLRAPFKTRTQSREIHFFCSFIAAFHVCYPAL